MNASGTLSLPVCIFFILVHPITLTYKPNIYVSWSTSELMVRLAPWNWFKPSSKIFLLTVPRRYFFCGSFVSCVSHAFASVHCCCVVTCWERTDLLALVGDVYCIFVLSFFLSIFTGSLIYEHYTRECEFRNFDKIKNTKTQKNKTTQKKHKNFWLNFCLNKECYFPMWNPGSGVVLNCIVTWSLPPFLLCTCTCMGYLHEIL